MAFAWWFAALALLAMLFVIWPLLGSGKKTPETKMAKSDKALKDDAEVTDRVAINNALYEEHVAELQEQRDRGALTDQEFEKLRDEARLQRDQDNDLHSVAVSDHTHFRKWPVAVLAMVLPLIAVALYWQLGAAQDWQIEQLIQEKNRLENREAEPERIRALARELQTKLRKRVADQPDNLNGWMMLARTSFELRNFADARQAYEHILERRPQSPQVITELAQTVYLSSGSQFNNEVQSLFDRALALAPENTQILGLAGFNAFQSGEYETAIAYWRRILDIVPESDPSYATWEQSVQQARRQLGRTGPIPESEGKQEAEEGPSVAVTVKLGENLDPAPDPGDTVFIYARAWQGPKMPLALARLSVAQLPTTVELNQSNAMAAGMTIAQFEQLEVVARISPSGLAQAQSGDWQATGGPVPVEPDQTAELVIDSQIP